MFALRESMTEAWSINSALILARNSILFVVLPYTYTRGKLTDVSLQNHIHIQIDMTL